MAENRFRTPWNIWNASKLRMYGEPWDKSSPRDSPNVSLHIVNNNPRFRVYMNDGVNKGPISYTLDPIKVYTFFEAILHAGKNKEPSRVGFELKSTFDHKGRQTDKPAPVSKIFVGRNSDGIIFMAFQAKGEKAAVFNFKSDYYAVLLGSDGEALDPKLASELTARGWVELLKQMVGPFLVVHGKEPPKRENNNGNSNNDSSTSGGGDNFDTDIPF